MRHRRRFVLCLALTAVVAARPAAAADRSAERLAGLIRVWGVAKYLHPGLGDGVGWDAAFVDAVPAVRAATSTEEYRAAVQSLLDRLDDPLTRVVGADEAAAVATDLSRGFAITKTGDGVVVVQVGDYYSLSSSAARGALARLPDALRGARAAVFDLRSSLPTETFGRLQLAAAFASLEPLLTAVDLTTPGERRRVYYGFESPSIFASGQYRSGLLVHGSGEIQAQREIAAGDLHSVFLLNRHAGLPASAPALQRAGVAKVVYAGDLATHTVGEVETVVLGERSTAQVRRSQSVFADGTAADLVPDAIVAVEPGSDADAGLEKALELARSPSPSRVRQGRPALATAVPGRERPDTKMRYPDLPYRVLAAARLWNAIEHFYPYKSLLDDDWYGVLSTVLPRFVTARDAREYALAVAELARRIHDSHAYVSGGAYTEEVIGAGYPPIRVRIVEGQPVVTGFRDEEAAAAAGVEVGAEVVSVDGRPAEERLAEIAGVISASTSQSRMDKAALSFLNGPVGSAVTLRLRDVEGEEKEVVLDRRHEDYTTLYHRERSGEVVRILPGNVGYVDLDRLQLADVDAMFERLAETAAIVFDMRGYPHGTIWAIAPRLARVASPVARFATPLLGHRSPEPASESFVQTVEPAPAAQRYTGRTALLIDERTMSQAEHTGLYLKAANDTLFVGSPTAGANGELASVRLPGGLAVGFTGQAVTHPDGRQLQRVGLVPDIEARPTIAGLHAGHDEVLDAALRALTGDAASAAAVGGEPPPDWAALAAARLPLLAPCELPNAPEPVLCGTIEVAENRDAPSGRRLGLKVVVVPAQAVEPPADPVFVFEGGPGGAATGRALGSIYSGAVRARDIVLVDQRGTGGSNPLRCDDEAPGRPGELREIFPTADVEACAAALGERADLSQYTSDRHADDIEEVRRALGYGPINLRGGSYGTWAMMVYAQRYPESVRTLFGIGLDSPLRSNLAERGVFADRTLGLVSELCAAAAACAAVAPDLDAMTRAIVGRLADGPRRVVVPDPADAAAELEIDVGRDWLTEQLRLILYFAFTSRALPWAVHRAHDADDWRPLVTLAVGIEHMLRSNLARGVVLTVQCSEMMDFDLADARRRGAATLFGNYRLEQGLQGCAAWPHVPRKVVDPSRVLDVPTLLLSGALDPVTPPEYAEEVTTIFPNSRHIVVRQGQHGPFDLEDSWTCVHRIWADFLEAGSVDDLDVACAENLRRPPFVVDGGAFDAYVAEVLGQL